MRKCFFLFLLFVFALAIAAISENRERLNKDEVVMDLKNSDEVAVQDNTSDQSAEKNYYNY
jgi:hypothetical protein